MGIDNYVPEITTKQFHDIEHAPDRFINSMHFLLQGVYEEKENNHDNDALSLLWDLSVT